MFKLAKHLKEYKKQVILGPMFKLLEAVLELFVPLIMAKIIDVGIKNADQSYILKMSLLIALTGMLGYGFALLCQYYASQASQGFGTKLRNALFSHINTLSHKELDTLSTSTLMVGLSNDVNNLQLGVAMLIRLVARAPFLAIGSVVMAFIINAKLALLFIVVTIVISLILYFISKNLVSLYKTIQTKLDKVSMVTREILSGVRVIRAFSKQTEQTARFSEASDEFVKENVRVSRLSSALNPLTTIVMNFGIVMILYFGSKFVFNGQALQGEIVALVSYMTQTLLALIVVSQVVIIFTKAGASAERINKIFKTHSTLAFKTIPIVPPQTDVAIEFKDVSFSYSGTGLALKQISFIAKQGETIGMIGGTGSGKTTIGALIMRFYDATSGTILLNGVDIQEYPKEQLKDLLSVAMQNAVLFSGTIKENLLMGVEHGNQEKIQQAIEISQANEFVSKLENGIETIINQRGKKFSGGQKQRLTIATALVSEPRVLLLDDSFSALDYNTSKNLSAAIKSRLYNTTVFVISQRINNIKNCDKIMVLEDGKLVDFADHNTLLKRCHVYQEIYSTQA